MAWRFSPSKFKNTAVRLPKKEETIYDLTIGNLSASNNGIAASSDFLTFLVDGEGGKLGVLPVDARGKRLRNEMAIICAHGEAVADFCFLPFQENLLATASRNDSVKLWNLSEYKNGLEGTSVSTPTAQISLGDGRTAECLSAHKTSDGILALGFGSRAAIIDVERCCIPIELKGNDELDRILSLDWSEDGKLLVVSGNRGKSGEVFDPRASTESIASFSLHSGIGRDGRILFADNHVVSSGFTQQRAQELLFIDQRSDYKQVHVERFPSTGLLLPFYDADTRLVFSAAKGANSLIVGEFRDKSPVFSLVSDQSLSDSTLGACMYKKRNCDLMSGEVQRMFQLTKSAIIPYPCIVPRRSYREFHADLYPNTIGAAAGCKSEQWLQGANDMPAKVVLRPDGVKEVECTTPETPKELPAQEPPSVVKSSSIAVKAEKEKSEEKPVQPPVRIANRVDEVPNDSEECKENQKTIAKVAVVRMRGTSQKVGGGRPCSALGMVQSKFRHLETSCGANKKIFTNVRNVNTRLPAESNGFCVSSKYAAIPLASAGGVIAICDLSNPGKVPDGVVDGIWNKTNLTDLQWNPFNPSELAVGLDNGTVNIWRITDELFANKAEEDSEGPKLADLELYQTVPVAAGERITQLVFHPSAQDVLALGLSDGTVKIWRRDGAPKCIFATKCHNGPVISLAWSANGKCLCSLGKDCQLKLFSPQESQNCIAESTVLESPRGGRVLFVCDDTFIMVVGFDRFSKRRCALYAIEDGITEVDHVALDSGTQLPMPHYDADTSVLFLAAKGDRIIHMYEINSTAPHFLPLSSWSAPSNHQAISLQPKNVCDVRLVEFRCGWRLTDKTLERISFKVPRVKKDLFQRDIFPSALITWAPSLSASEWEQGEFRPPQREDLKPADMPENESKPKQQNGTERSSLALKRERNISPDSSLDPSADKAKVQEVVKASWSDKIGVDKKELEQDNMQGVAEEEWID